MLKKLLIKNFNLYNIMTNLPDIELLCILTCMHRHLALNKLHRYDTLDGRLVHHNSHRSILGGRYRTVSLNHIHQTVHIYNSSSALLLLCCQEYCLHS